MEPILISATILWLQDCDDISEKCFRTNNTLRVMGKHNNNLHTQHTLSHKDVSDSSINILPEKKKVSEIVNPRELSEMKLTRRHVQS